MRLNLETREKVVKLKKQGYMYQAIRDRLEEEGISVTIKTLYLLLAKYNQAGYVADRPQAKPQKLLNREHYSFIDNALAENDELTTRQLHKQLVQWFPGLKVLLSTVKRARYELGWVVSSPKYCQMIRDANKEKRLA